MLFGGYDLLPNDSYLLDYLTYKFYNVYSTCYPVNCYVTTLS